MTVFFLRRIILLGYWTNDSTRSQLKSRNCPANQQQEKIKALQRALKWLSLFFCVELGVGLWIHSLSLVVDAGHMLLDFGALGLTLLATWFAQRSAINQTTQTHHRVEILAALGNGFSLLLLACWAMVEALLRLQHPAPDILSLPMLITAVIGLGINGCNAVWLHQHSHEDLNVKAAFLHILADAVSSVGVVLAAIAITWMHWLWIDGWIGLAIAGLIFCSTLPLIFQSLRRLRQPNKSGMMFSCDCQQENLKELLYPVLEEIIK